MTTGAAGRAETVHMGFGVGGRVEHVPARFCLRVLVQPGLPSVAVGEGDRLLDEPGDVVGNVFDQPGHRSTAQDTPVGPVNRIFMWAPFLTMGRFLDVETRQERAV